MQHGHDWHATGKLFWAEILLGFNFDPHAQIRYRTRKGTEATLARGDLAYSDEALLARDRLLRTSNEAAEIGAWCGWGRAVVPDTARPTEGAAPRGARFARVAQEEAGPQYIDASGRSTCSQTSGAAAGNGCPAAPET